MRSLTIEHLFEIVSATDYPRLPGFATTFDPGTKVRPRPNAQVGLSWILSFCALLALARAGGPAVDSDKENQVEEGIMQRVQLDLMGGQTDGMLCGPKARGFEEVC